MRLREIFNVNSGTAINYDNTVLNQINDRWIVAQRENVAVSISSGLIEVSTNNSDSFDTSLAFADADKIRQGYVHENGNISFFTNDNKIYKTNTQLTTITEKLVYETDGVTPYPIHTPANASFPGMYYNTTAYDDQETSSNVFAFVNYANAYNTGAAPLHLIYTPDFAENWYVGYKFGQNLRYRDNGTGTGGNTGTILGDASSSIIIRHGHSLIYYPQDGRYLCFTGDERWLSGGMQEEVQWIWFDYDTNSGNWTPDVVNFGFVPTANMKLKVTDAFFVGDILYYVSDYTGGTDLAETGIFKVPVADIDNYAAHEQLIPLQNATDVIVDCGVDRNTGYIVATVAVSPFPYTTYRLLIAKDYGEGDFAFKDFANTNLIRVNSPNNKGFFRMDSSLDIFGTLKGETLMIKIGDDLFDNI